jgi:hypothetical protein
VGGRLALFYSAWSHITSISPWLLAIVKNGFRLPLTHSPPLTTRFHHTQLPSNQQQIISLEIETLLLKNAIEIAPSSPGFHSTLFTIPKKDGGLRPVLNLKHLNQFLPIKKFKMETLSTIIHLIRPNDYLTSIDLKDAFHHILIHPSHRHLLRFVWKNTTYQYRTVPFGLSLAPWLFTKMTKPIITWARSQGIRMTAYLDDFLIIAPNAHLSQLHTNMIKEKMIQLGWLLNDKKSHLSPTQSIQHLGMNINTNTMSISIPGKKIRSIRRQAYHLLYQQHTTVRTLAAFIGTALATQLGNQQARFRTRHLINHLNTARSSNIHSWTQTCNITSTMRQELLWWINQLTNWNGKQMIQHRPTIQIFTDSSTDAWGIVHQQQQWQGQWTLQEQSQHINYKELLVIWKALQVVPLQPHHHLQLCIDNTSAISYINNFGGTRSKQLNTLARKIWTHCFHNHIHLSTLYVPSQFNPADAPSRRMIQQNEWQINPTTFNQINNKWGPHTIDLFASHTNHKLPQYVTWNYDPKAAWTNAFSRNWSTIQGRLYICPPWNLIQPILLRLQHQPRPTTIITPHWPSAPWWPTLTAMARSRPLPLPQHSVIDNKNDNDLIQHPHLRHNLTAWNI